MTDEEYQKLVAQIAAQSGVQLATPQALGGPSAQLPLESSAAPTISNVPSLATISGRPTPTAPSADVRAQGLTTPELTNVATPTRISFDPSGELTVATPTQSTFIAGGKGTPADLNKLIDYQIKDRQQRYDEQQENLPKAIAMLQDIDATDEQKAQAQKIVQAPKVAPPFAILGRNEDGSALTMSDLKTLIPGFDDLSKTDQSSQLRQLSRAAYVATITPDTTPQEAALKQYTNLQMGPSWRALQDLGIQYPGVSATSKYATVPQFIPNAPYTQRGELLSGQPGYPPIPAQKVQPAQAPGQQQVGGGTPSNIGLTTVRGTEFGEVDRPTRGGYTEQGWNIGARGADLTGWNNEGVALPLAVLSKYGNPNDKDFIDKFNSNYDVQVVDTKTGKAVTSSLKDYGPGPRTGAGIDLLAGTRNNLGLPTNFSGSISYRIVPKGTSLPANTTASVQQTQQQNQQVAQNQNIASGQFAPGANATEVYLQPLSAAERAKVREPSIYGKTMPNDELLKWARIQTDDWASALASAQQPVDTKQYQDAFQRFYESAQKYKDAKEDLKQAPPDYQDQFASLAALVSPTAAVNPDGTKMSQIELLLDLHKRLQQAGAGVGGLKTDEAREFDAQTGHLVANVARGLFGQKGNLSESEQKAAAEGIPTYWDSEKSAQFKTNLLKSAIQDKMRQIINLAKAQHYDTTALEQEYRRIFVPSTQAQGASLDQSRQQIKAVAPGANTATVAQPQLPQPQPPVFDTSTNQFVGAGQ